MKILIVAAMDTEIVAINNKLINTENYHEEEVEGFHFYFGTLNHHEIILVKSGVGRVNSAILITLAKLHYAFDRVINIGLAGGVTGLAIKDIVIGEQSVYGDADLTPFMDKYVYGQMSGCPATFKGDEFLLDVIHKNDSLSKNVVFGTICSREMFTVDKDEVNSLINSHFKNQNIVAFDMESACYAQACLRFNIPFLAIRCISDIIGSDGQVDTFRNTEDDIAKNKRYENYIVEIINHIA